MLCQHHAGGLSTREGLALALHDGYSEKGKETVPPIHDKRLFLYESEFAQVLEQGKRSGNTLLPALRECWDFGSQIKPLTKGEKVWSTHPHIGLLGNITPHELKQKLTGNDIHGGTLNRFLLVFAERTCLLPSPTVTPQQTVNDLANRIVSVLAWTKGSYGQQRFNHQQQVMMTVADNATQLWLREYARLRTPQGSPTVQATLERIAPYTWRIALLMAVLDGKTEIEAAHLASGIAWVDYAAASVRYVFADTTEEVSLSDKQQKLLDYLTAQTNQEASRSSIIKICFNRNISSGELDGLLQALIDQQLISKREEKPEGGGKVTSIYQRTNFTNFTNNVDFIDDYVRTPSTTYTTTELAAVG